MRNLENSGSSAVCESPNDIIPRIIVIGVGNAQMKDKGIGVHIVQALQQLSLPPDVKLIDSRMSPEPVFNMRVKDKMIIINAAKVKGKPGSIYCFKIEDILAEKDILYFAHELSVIECINLVTFTEDKPKDVIIIGIEPDETGWGTELSPCLQQKLPEIFKVVLDEIYK